MIHDPGNGGEEDASAQVMPVICGPGNGKTIDGIRGRFTGGGEGKKPDLVRSYMLKAIGWGILAFLSLILFYRRIL